MSDAYIENKLRTLTQTEREVLYFKCQGLNQTAIGTRIGKNGIGKERVKQHMTSIYAKLLINTKGITDWRVLDGILQEQYCQAITRIIDDEINLDVPTEEDIITIPPNWAIQAIEKQVIDEEEEEEKRLTQHPPTGIQVPPQPQVVIVKYRSPWWIWLLVASIAVLGGGFIYLIKRPPISSPPIFQVVTATQSKNELIIINTPEITSTYTITPSITPSFTPTITHTPTAEPEYLFNYSFKNEQSIPDAIHKESGDLLLGIDGLTTSGSAAFSLGDSSWKNYKVELFVSGMRNCDFGLDIGVRVKNSANMMYMLFRSCSTRWVTLANGKHTILYQTLIDLNDNLPERRLEISVNGNMFESLSSIGTDKYPNGGLYITLIHEVSIEYIKVTKLP